MSETARGMLKLTVIEVEREGGGEIISSMRVQSITCSQSGLITHSQFSTIELNWKCGN